MARLIRWYRRRGWRDREFETMLIENTFNAGRVYGHAEAFGLAISQEEAIAAVERLKAGITSKTTVH